MINIDWSKQINGVHQASLGELLQHMPDLMDLVETFPDEPFNYTWDVKVHMLMPSQFPCIPNWHYDNVPRVNNKQDFDKVRIDAPMYLWLSGTPLTEFRKGDKSWLVPEQEWYKFTQLDEHRGTMSDTFTWRAFVRATHHDILPANGRGHDPVRRHSQVYLDSGNFKW